MAPFACGTSRIAERSVLAGTDTPHQSNLSHLPRMVRLSRPVAPTGPCACGTWGTSSGAASPMRQSGFDNDLQRRLRSLALTTRGGHEGRQGQGATRQATARSNRAASHTASNVANAAKIEADVSAILGMTWAARAGQVIPKTDDVALKNGAVKLSVVMLYADLFHSTTLARTFPRSVAAKIVRAYLSSMTQMVTKNGGQVRSFDGDRVMGVFVGANKNTAAAMCALQMNYIVQKILRPAAEAKFPSLKTKGFAIGHCAGVAKSDVFVVRGGVRGSNDLVFIGSAPNIAAKLSEIRNSSWRSYITWDVFRDLPEGARLGANKQPMWTPVKRTIGKDSWSLYRSNWTWKP
jgi:adenylate cyclase